MDKPQDSPAGFSRGGEFASEEASSNGFEPGTERKVRLREEIVRLLRKRGPQGITRLEAPRHLVLSMPARICELRKEGYKIDTRSERHGNSLIARYILLEEPQAHDFKEASHGGD